MDVRLTLFCVFLSGVLPQEYASWTQLTELYLGTNAFSGTLPTAWSSMSQLDAVNICENDLSGTLPKELVQYM